MKFAIRRLLDDKNALSLAATLSVFVILYGLGAAIFPGFASLRSFVNLFRNNAHLGVIAIGMTFVILSGGIDLSVGSIFGFSTILIATAIDRLHLHPLAAWSMTLAAGSLMGLVMGLLIHYYRLPAFLVTLAGMFFARGMAFVVHHLSLRIDHAFYDAATVWGIPLDDRGVAISLSMVVLAATLGAALYLAHYTRFGRNVYAIGGSESSALLMGLPVASTKVRVYGLSGFCSALAGIVSTLDTHSGDPARGNGLELAAIASVVIGGASLSGGIGHVAGTLLGVMIYGTIRMSIDFHGGLDSSFQPIFIGLLLLVFVLLQKLILGLNARRSPAGS